MAKSPDAVFRVMPLAELNPAAYNPRKITDEALIGLENTIEEFGLVQNLVWNAQTGNLVGGHQRMKVLAGQKVTEAMVCVVDVPLAREKALNVALNNPHIAGTFDDGLQELLQEIQIDDDRLFRDVHLDKLLGVIPDDTDWGDALGTDGDGEEPETMQRTFMLSGSQCIDLDRSMEIAIENGLAMDPNNQNKNGNALHAICCGFLLWAKQNK